MKNPVGIVGNENCNSFSLIFFAEDIFSRMWKSSESARSSDEDAGKLHLAETRENRREKGLQFSLPTESALFI